MNTNPTVTKPIPVDMSKIPAEPPDWCVRGDLSKPDSARFQGTPSLRQQNTLRDISIALTFVFAGVGLTFAVLPQPVQKAVFQAFVLKR